MVEKINGWSKKMKMFKIQIMAIIIGLLACVPMGCVDQEDLIYADPDYNGPGELLECDAHIPCPQVCRFYVDVDGSPTANGRSWNTALRHIQPAINKATVAPSNPAPP